MQTHSVLETEFLIGQPQKSFFTGENNFSPKGTEKSWRGDLVPFLPNFQRLASSQTKHKQCGTKPARFRIEPILRICQATEV